jgi:hypothetical protein
LQSENWFWHTLGPSGSAVVNTQFNSSDLSAQSSNLSQKYSFLIHRLPFPVVAKPTAHIRSSARAHAKIVVTVVDEVKVKVRDTVVELVGRSPT